MIRPGDRVGGYEILSKLSAGGMATLYLGRRGGAAGFRKHVAIKVVHEHLAEDATFVQMFVDEALLSSRIQHPNVVHIEELRELDGQHFLVMEYVSGVALSQLMRRLSHLKRRLTPELAAYVAIQVADGLHAAHELKDEAGELEGVVHRDVSPQNVLLAWEGHVKLIDFGVAKARSRIQQTTGASLKGKLRYMAPEQARGAEVDRRTDVYALGILLWEMLTMRKRFHGPNDFALLDKVRNPDAIPPSQLNSAITPQLDAVVMRAMAVSMEDRYASAQEFRRALAASLPQALALDASHLSDLVRTACPQELEKARKRLPSSMHLPSDIPVVDEGNPEPLHAMTVSVALEHVEDGPCSSVFTPSSAISSGPSGSKADGTSHTVSHSAPVPSRGKALLIATAMAALVVAGVVGFGALRGSTSNSGVAVPLAPRAAASAPAAAPPGLPDVTTPAPAAASPTEIVEAPSTATPDAGAPPVADAVQPEPDPGARTSRMPHASRMSSTRQSSMTPSRSSMRSHTMAVPLAEDFGF